MRRRFGRRELARISQARKLKRMAHIRWTVEIPTFVRRMELLSSLRTMTLAWSVVASDKVIMLAY
jgi:bacteriorhodopsin